MIEENWDDVTLYRAHMVDDGSTESKEELGLFLFNSEIKRNEILYMLTSSYGVSVE